MRHKPLYNNLRLTYQDTSGIEQKFYCNEISRNKIVNSLIGMPVKDSGARYITSSDIDFELDGLVIENDNIHRIQSIPDIKPIRDNNSRRRGTTRKVKVIETT